MEDLAEFMFAGDCCCKPGMDMASETAFIEGRWADPAFSLIEAFRQNK